MAEQSPQDLSQEELVEQARNTNAEIAAAVERMGGVPNIFHFMESDGSIKPVRGYWLLGNPVINEVGVFLGPDGLEVYNYHLDLQTVGQNAGFIPERDRRLEVTAGIVAEFGPKAREALIEFEKRVKPRTQLASIAKGLDQQFRDIG